MDLSGLVTIRYGSYDTPADGSKGSESASETPKQNVSIYDSIRAAAAKRDVLDDDTCFRLYIDSKLQNLTDDAAVESFVDDKLKEYGMVKEEEQPKQTDKEEFDSMTPKQRASYKRFYKRVRDKLADEDKERYDKVLDGYSADADLKGTDVDDETKRVEDSLKAKGYNVEVSNHKIKHVTPCLRVEVKDENIDGLKESMTELGYGFKSKYKSSYYFVKG